MSGFQFLLKIALLFIGYNRQHIFGKYIKGSEIMTIDTIGIKKCGQHCLSITGCLAYNYDREMLHCHLLADNSSTGTLIESEKIRYKNRENIPSDRHGLCMNPDCPKFSQCVKLSSGQQTCVRQVCDHIPSYILIEEAVASPKHFRIGTTLHYNCKINETVVDNNITCKANGQWSSVNPDCVCEDPPPSFVSDEAAASNKGFEAGTILLYNCTIAETSVTNSVTCKTDGQWTPVNTKCECGTPFLPFSKRPTCSNIGCEATFICLGNYIVEGNDRIRCSSHNGSWVTLGDYRCVPSGCNSSTPIVKNASFKYLECSSKSCNAVYHCDVKYRLIQRSTTAHCYLSEPVKMWMEPTPPCLYDCAKYRPVVSHSTLSDPGCSTACTYICDYGYTLIGTPERYCSPENGWDSSETSCV